MGRIDYVRVVPLWCPSSPLSTTLHSPLHHPKQTTATLIVGVTWVQFYRAQNGGLSSAIPGIPAPAPISTVPSAVSINGVFA